LSKKYATLLNCRRSPNVFLNIFLSSLIYNVLTTSRLKTDCNVTIFFHFRSSKWSFSKTFTLKHRNHPFLNLMIFQQNATVFNLLHFCRQLYMFRVLTPIIRSWYSCNLIHDAQTHEYTKYHSFSPSSALLPQNISMHISPL